MKELIFRHCSEEMRLGPQVAIMGILNVTPDSFSDGGEYSDADAAVARGIEMVAQGATILDIGGESTRPGAAAVSADEEIRRTCPVVKALAKAVKAPISIDTSKALVARAAVDAGATIVNDVSGLQRDPAMVDVLRETRAGCIVMHMRGVPGSMQTMTDYGDLIGEIRSCLAGTVRRAVESTGLGEEYFMVDPGIGFAKTAEQNLDLIACTDIFRADGRPVLMGPSRKSFIGNVTGRERPSERLWGTAAAVAACVLYGADVVRVHDVAEMRDVVAVARVLRDARSMASG